RRKRLCMLLHSTCCPSNLACVDMKGFDPSDVNVTVRDGKVTVAAERKEEHHTCLGRASNYRKFVKEFNLPPGVTDDEVTYSV
ncbi:ODFP1 protein, partial [Drymodes brunneopygia]|nr:ODFP1 protein [Drymodes brunneopygia]